MEPIADPWDNEIAGDLEDVLTELVLSQNPPTLRSEKHASILHDFLGHRNSKELTEIAQIVRFMKLREKKRNGTVATLQP